MTTPEETPNNFVAWTVDSTHPEKSSILRAAMSEVMDPELGLSILQLGLVREVAISEGAATVRMMLTTPFCPYGPALMENTRQKCAQALGISVTVEFDEDAWNPSMMDEDAAAELGFFF